MPSSKPPAPAAPSTSPPDAALLPTLLPAAHGAPPPTPFRAHPFPRPPLSARINYAGADEMTPFVTAGTVVNDFIRADLLPLWTTRTTPIGLSTLSKLVSRSAAGAFILGVMSALTDRRLLDHLFARWGPVVHARDAAAGGLPRGLLVRSVDRADLIRIGKAAFVRSQVWDDADERERFRLRSLGFGLCLGEAAHLTGAAAALLLGLPLVDDPVGLPVAIRPGNAHVGHDRSPYGRVRRGFLPLTCRTERSRVRVVSSAFCAVDIARHLGPSGFAPVAWRHRL